MTVTPELVRRIAEDAGFDLVRFGRPDPGDHGDRFAAWLEAGRAGEMRYLERNADRILDPGRWVPGTRSAICLGWDYGGADPVTVEGGGRVARYARGRDYHRVLGGATKRIRTALEREGVHGGALRAGTDAVPILERALAVHSGVGFLAKSAGVISPQLGPYLFLSEVLTPLELPFDLPSPGSCGTCTKCIDACPTGAIVAPFELDARRCLSYTTIERRGPVPAELREAQGDWLFGCDICLEVCPFTSKERASPRPETTTHAALETFSLVGILELSADDWDRHWVGTAIRRATRSGLRRNAATVLGNLGDAAAAPALERALDDPDPVVREHAAWSLGRVSPRSRALEARLSVEGHAGVRNAIGAALARR